ncbi:arsenical pump-driving ATPase GET3 [Salinarchaeum sp. IM2453]|uniref:ArsA family ATPase n=1 Tax=Salinarchaeum sp. IM2453 TaxID=2862870 RepID=UPI001C836667|nr:TRC40/GET3/ArsA family transport-energizing ATPase [Salinarchaeum sp. IM2453]QZA88763.1 arsenical pump-driving ATPase GET3 [Salinarchaeum sp. IM2453]
MSDIDVTPVDEIDTEDQEIEKALESVPKLDDSAPEYVLYGGKGGVGKTTMAAATGLASANTGTKTLVISTDPAHSLSDTLEVDIGAEPTPIDDELPLWGVEINPEKAMEEGATMFGEAAEDAQDDASPFGGDDQMDGMGPMGMGGMGDMMDGGGPMEAMLGGSMPGADEAVAMQKLIDYLDDDRFERVVVDTAPTGHTLRLLKLPEVMDSMVGRVLMIQERISQMMDGLKGMFGGDAEQDNQDIEELRELQEGIEQLRAVLQDPAMTDFRIVMIPEELSVTESKRLREQLREFSIPVSTIVVNRVMEPLSSAAEDVDDEDILSPNLEDCEFCQRRWDVQQAALKNAQDLFREHEVKRVPLFAEEIRGKKMLKVIAACLK